nr:MAG TPA: hypothetical protein [Caudoviricetes sp.]
MNFPFSVKNVNAFIIVSFINCFYYICITCYRLTLQR